jgi:hypothetical protein
MPSTKTKTLSGTQTIMLDAEACDAPGLESSESSTSAMAGGPVPLPAAPAGALSRQLIEEALDQARLRRAVSELPQQQRSELIEALLEQLADGREDLPEELNERVLDGMLGALIAGKRGEREILGSDGVLGELTRRLIELRLPRSSASSWATRPVRRRPAG